MMRSEIRSKDVALVLTVMKISSRVDDGEQARRTDEDEEDCDGSEGGIE